MVLVTRSVSTASSQRAGSNRRSTTWVCAPSSMVKTLAAAEVWYRGVEVRYTSWRPNRCAAVVMAALHVSAA